MQRVLRPCEWFNAGLTLIDGDMPIKESMPSLWLYPLQKIGFPKNEAGHFSSAVSNKPWSDWMSFHTFQTWNDLATNITLFSFRNRVVDGNIENQKSLHIGTLRFLLQSWIPNLATWSWKKNLEHPIFCMSRCEYYELWKDDFQNPRLASSGYMESQSNQHGAWITKLRGFWQHINVKQSLKS